MDSRIEAIKGDITKFEVDAIVNAANASLKGGGGVDGAIHRAGGPQILEDCIKIVNRQGKLPAGEAVTTTAGRMPSALVIHTVGPVWGGGHKNEEQTLAKAYHNSLELAAKNGCKTIAFPNISTGVYGFPKDKAAKIAVNTVNQFLDHNSVIEKVYLVCFDDENYELIQKQLT